MARTSAPARRSRLARPTLTLLESRALRTAMPPAAFIPQVAADWATVQSLGGDTGGQNNSGGSTTTVTSADGSYTSTYQNTYSATSQTVMTPYGMYRVMETGWTAENKTTVDGTSSTTDPATGATTSDVTHGQHNVVITGTIDPMSGDVTIDYTIDDGGTDDPNQAATVTSSGSTQTVTNTSHQDWTFTASGTVGGAGS